MTTIGEVCMRDPVIATPETTITAAAKLMRENHVGSVIVVDRIEDSLRLPLGIVTDRDLVVEVTATGLDPNTITVGDIMAPELVTILAGKDIASAVRYMRSKGVRRLPVVNEGGKLVGLASFDDVLETVVDDLVELARTPGIEQSREARQRS
jgi:CBS domain-containing protein